ncbi:MAG: hydroxymethylbilane synthase [Alphaproteobacteria bacterium]|nr:hydroxymethylbilane synthase [Alphaproteobacteria bacterium]
MKKTIRLGTRGSPLALIQAEEIRRRLFAAHPSLADDTVIDIVPIRTTGDWRPEHKDRRFIDMGGNKGLFTKEIEDALLSGYIDMAVHSMKDVASALPSNLAIGAIIARDDPRDVFIGRTASTLADMPPGGVVGTSSLRRQAQILALRPDLRVVPLRGNVETRLQKIDDGVADATLLALAGLARLGMEKRATSILSATQIVPAAGQGALGVEIRTEDNTMRALLSPLNHAETSACVIAERAVMRAIDGSCHTPAGAHATLDAEGVLHIDALVARADGTDMKRLTSRGAARDADAIGYALGHELRAQSPADLFAA